MNAFGTQARRPADRWASELVGPQFQAIRVRRYVPTTLPLGSTIWIKISRCGRSGGTERLQPLQALIETMTTQVWYSEGR
jgi:hypothetical protein